MPEPKSSIRTKVYHAPTIADLADETKRKHVAYVQGIPEFLKAPEGIKYSALDIPDEREAEGKQKLEDFEIEFLFTEEQYDELKVIQKAKNNEVWAIQLPEETATTTGKPLTWYWAGTCFVGMAEIADEDMLKAKVKIYRSTEIEESKGFPHNSSTKMSARSRTKKETSTEETIEAPQSVMNETLSNILKENLEEE